MTESILVTGGAGFIGSNFVRHWLRVEGSPVVNLDLLTYAGNPVNLAPIAGDPRHRLIVGDIADAELVSMLLREHRPRAIVHCAAATHVDRSITDPDTFLRTNVIGTQRLLEAARSYWATLDPATASRFRFLHISTDEVYGSLRLDEAAFTEESRYAPNNPYAASKAASDHLVRAWHHTYGLPVVTTNCSNNYGPCQFPEKLIPLMLLRALEWKTLPVYGDGRNRRDWLFVEDHCAALRLVLDHGRLGEVYNIGGGAERTNLEVVYAVCDLLDAVQPEPGRSRRDLVRFVADRPGHDLRYATDAGKLQRELGWQPSLSMEDGLARTIAWYIENGDWVRGIETGAYRDWIEAQYGGRSAGAE